jgi:hypothetical protein
MENSQFEEWLADYEAELREGVQKRFGLTDGISDKNRLSDESLQGKDQDTVQCVYSVRSEPSSKGSK